MPSVELSIIVVNWNGMSVLPNCLYSISNNPPDLEYEVIVVDNMSTDGSREWLISDAARHIFSENAFKVILSKDNLGFGMANNLAVEKSNSEYVFLLNPDTIVTKDAISNLLKPFDNDEQIGLTIPKLLNSDGTTQFNVWAYPPSATKILFQGLKLYKFISKNLRARWLKGEHWNYENGAYIESASGAAMMLKTITLDSIGQVFNPIFHMYGEDSELCHRLVKGGFRIYFEPKSEIIHLGGQSSVQRWGNNTTHKEEIGYLQFLLLAFPRTLVIRNIMARLGLFSLFWVKNFRNREIRRKLVDSILIQLRGLTGKSLD